MRTFCKNCSMECWKDDPTGCFSINGFSENCSLYIYKMSNKSIDQLLYEENQGGEKEWKMK